MMISPGAIVTVKQFGTALWVVKRPASGGRWYLSGKVTDKRGRVSYRGHWRHRRDPRRSELPSRCHG